MPALFLLGVIPAIVTVVLFVLLFRNRKQDRLTRRRFLVLFLAMLGHTLVLIAGGFATLPIGLLEIFFLSSMLILFVVLLVYLANCVAWKNLDLTAATVVFALYVLLFFFFMCFALAGS